MQNTPSPKKETLVLIDGHAIIHRAYHALPPMSTSDGTSVHAVYGFALMLLKTIQDLQPTYMAVSFDVSGETFRDELYDDYKATREKADDDLYAQIPLVYELVEAFGIPHYEKEGFEADDIIGTIAEKNKKKKNLTTIVVTGDKDLLQLVDDEHTEVYLLKKGMSDFELYTEAAVTNKFGFGPEHIVDYKAFRGDTSDNIPGVKGIGDKTATTLITEVGGIDEIYTSIKDTSSHLYEVASKGVIAKLEDGENSARMSYTLATIRRDVPDIAIDLSSAQTDIYDKEALVSLFRKFEFFSLVSRIPGMENTAQKKKNGTKTKPRTQKLEIVSKDTCPKALQTLTSEPRIAAKAILSSQDVFTATLEGFVFVTDTHSYYIELKSLEKTQRTSLFSLFQNTSTTIVGHDLKSLVRVVLHELGYDTPIGPLFDVMIASYLLNSSSRAHDSANIILRELGEEITTSESQGTLFGIDPQVVSAELTAFLQVAHKFQSRFETKERTVFEGIEMPLIPVLAKMELTGVAVDTEALKTLSKDAHTTIKTLEQSIWKAAGKEFNVSSSVQLRDVLYQELELPTDMIKKGKTGYSTAASELEKLREFHDIIPLIEEYREVEKLRNTYIDVLPMLIHSNTHRIHTTYNQAVAATGRLSSSDPNLQNIPIRTTLGKEVRNTFVAREGYTLMSADYSQIELRIVAHLAKDKTLIDIFSRGEDVHTATAAAIHDLPIENVTSEIRRTAKEVNFGVLYGMGPFGLASRTGISQAEAKEFIAKYFDRFHGVKTYLDRILKEAKETGYVETLFGRRRYIPELTSKNYQVRNSGERMAINMPVQGTAADMMKLAMIAVDKDLATACEAGDAWMLLQVHDELVMEVKQGKEAVVGDIVETAMKNVLNLSVPVLVDVHTGPRWGDLK